MIRCVPFLLILAGCTGYGISCAREYESKYRELIYLKQVMTNLKIALNNGRLTFGECCYEVSRSCRKPYDEVLSEMYIRLEKERECGLVEVWQSGLGRLVKELDIKELGSLQQATYLGDATFVEQPVETIEELIVVVEDLIRQTEKVKKEKSRLSICLGISGGCMLCLLFG